MCPFILTMPYFLPGRLRNNKGVSLIELLLVIALVGFLVLLVGNLPNSITLIGKANHQSIALKIASKAIEDKRGVKYTNLANGTSALSDSRLNNLPNGTGHVSVEDCGITLCPQGEAAKKITAKVTWKESGKNQEVSLQTLVSEGGLNQ